MMMVLPEDPNEIGDALFQLADIGLARLEVGRGGRDDQVAFFLKVAGHEAGQGGFAGPAGPGEENGARAFRGDQFSDDLVLDGFEVIGEKRR